MNKLKYPSLNLNKNCQNLCKNNGKEDEFLSWAHQFMPVHGTTLKRAISIISDKKIYSHKQLKEKHPEIYNNRILNNTDELDQEYGLDNYVFLNLGRVHPLHIHPVYFIFNNSLLEKENTLISDKEIANFGALVSPEAKKMALKENPKCSPKKINKKAAEKFFSRILESRSFIKEFFPDFLRSNYSQWYDFLFDLTYPGTKAEIRMFSEKEATVTNVWEGPQVMIQDEINLEENEPSILITNSSKEVSKKIKKTLLKSGIEEKRIFEISEVCETYSNILGEYKDILNEYKHINMALSDLCRMAMHNRWNKDLKGMMGFKNRV